MSPAPPPRLCLAGARVWVGGSAPPAPRVVTAYGFASGVRLASPRKKSCHFAGVRCSLDSAHRSCGGSLPCCTAESAQFTAVGFLSSEFGCSPGLTCCVRSAVSTETSRSRDRQAQCCTGSPPCNEGQAPGRSEAPFHVTTLHAIEQKGDTEVRIKNALDSAWPLLGGYTRRCAGRYRCVGVKLPEPARPVAPDGGHSCT